MSYGEFSDLNSGGYPPQMIPQYQLEPSTGFNNGLNLYANVPANQFALPGPASPLANIRNIAGSVRPEANQQNFIRQVSMGKPSPNLRGSTYNNPFMNIPITAYDQQEIYSDYNRYNSKLRPTPETEAVKKEVSNNFLQKLYQDPADVLFQRNNSQRQFYSVPIGGPSADTVEFAENLYGREYVCKGGSIYMNRGLDYTDDSLACTGYDVSTPTGFGALKY
jgi:hypothetical protein